MIELEAVKGKSQYEQETYEKFKEKLDHKENELQTLELKLHETTLQLELAKGEVQKMVSGQVNGNLYFHIF
jgi:chromosome segregation ATPase